MKKIIIAGFAGIGKTYLAKKYKNVIDLESSKFVYDYSNVPETEYERMKGKKDRIPNKDFPDNYIQALLESKKKYDIILIWLKLEMLPLYEKYHINYSVCYPSEKTFENYAQLYKERGNSDEWIEKVCRGYTEYVVALKSDKHPKIILDENENLESYLLKNGFTLVEKNGNIVNGG